MMDKVLSIAVPAYNAARYLEKCLSSFIFDGMQALDVIVVDDGSTDETGTIADKYAEEYPGIFRVIHKQNGGHGSGINCAIEVAQGKYFRVVDADDWVLSENMVEYLDALRATESDIVLTHFHTVDMLSGERTPYLNQGLEYNTVHNSTALLPMLEDAARWFCIHAIAYRTAFYRGLNLKLTERIFYEDTEYAVLPFAFCESIQLEDISIYEYLVGNTSQSVSINSYCKRYGHLEIVLQSLLTQYKGLHDENQVQKAFLGIRIQMLLGTYEKVVLTYLPDKAKGRKAVKEIRAQIKEADRALLRKQSVRHVMLLACNRAKVSPEWLERQYARFKRKMA